MLPWLKQQITHAPDKIEIAEHQSGKNKKAPVSRSFAISGIE